MQCKECNHEMVLVDTASGTQDNGCDVDVDLYECPNCGALDSD